MAVFSNTESGSSCLTLLVNELFAAFRAEKIPFLVLRNYENLPHSTDNDIDILVEAALLRRAETVTANVASRCGWRVHNRAEFSPVCLFLHHRQTLSQVQIDLFPRVEWRGIELISANDLFRLQKTHRTIPVPHPSHEAFLNLMGRLLPYGIVRDKYKHSIQLALVSEPHVFVMAAQAILGARLANLVADSCVRADWTSLEAMKMTLRRRLMMRRPFHTLAGWVGMSFRLVRRFLCPPGLSIVWMADKHSDDNEVLASCAESLSNTFNPLKSRFVELQLDSSGEGGSAQLAALPSVRSPSIIIDLRSYVRVCWQVLSARPTLFRNGAIFINGSLSGALSISISRRYRARAVLIRMLRFVLPYPDLILSAHKFRDLQACSSAADPDGDELDVSESNAIECPDESLNNLNIRTRDRMPLSVVLEFLVHRTLMRHPHLAVCSDPLQSPRSSDSGDRLCKVLLSAYACEPGRGSEPGVGWNVARELSRHVDLHVITRANNKNTIESSGEPWINNVKWHYWDPPRYLTFWKKGSRGAQIFYVIWQFTVFAKAKGLHAVHAYDIAHHVTFGMHWIPSRLAKLDCLFVFGPVGGADRSPPGFDRYASWRGRLAEVVKLSICHLLKRLPEVRSLYKRASLSLAATDATAKALQELGVENIKRLHQSGIADDFGSDIAASSILPNRRPIRLISACRLVHWKAVDLAIEALARTPDDVELVILQDGPECARLKSLTYNLKLHERVIFTGRLPTVEQVHCEISCADALIHPALHEAFGQACLEALALGVPVICLNWAGPGMIVDGESGFSVTPSNRAQTIDALVDSIIRLREEKLQGVSRADACRNRAFSMFSWSGFGDTVASEYRKLISGSEIVDRESNHEGI